MMQQIFSHPQVVGLILDVIGAFHIVKSFIFKNLKSLLAESYGCDYPEKGLTEGMSGNLFRSFYKQSVEAKTGFIIISLGFGGQILGVLIPNFVVNLWIGFSLIATAVLVPQILFKYLFKNKRLDKIEQKEN